MDQVTRSTTSSREERLQALATGPVGRQIVPTTRDRESSRSRESWQRLSGSNRRLQISPLRVPASPVAPPSTGSHCVQRATGEPSSTSRDVRRQTSNSLRTAQVNRLLAGSAGPNTVRQATSRATSGLRGETQDQASSASILQDRSGNQGGRLRPLSGSAPQWAGLVPLMGNLSLGVNPPTRSSGEQQEPDTCAARGPSASRSFIRPPRRQPQLSQVIEESRPKLSAGPTISGGSMTIPPRTTQATGTSARPPDTTGAGIAAGSLTSASQSGPRILNIGIETEFILAAHREDHSAETLEEFAMILAADHNLRVRGTQKKMRRDLRPMGYSDEYTDWCLVRDDTIERQRAPCKPLLFRVTHHMADRLLQGELSWSHQFSGPFPAQDGEEMWKRLGDIFTSTIKSRQILDVLPMSTSLSSHRVNTPPMTSGVSQDVSFTLNQLLRH
jgi:hypothetical protein